MSTARDLLHELEQHQVHVERHGDRLRLRAPHPPPPDLLERLRRCKPEVLPLLRDAKARAVIRWRLPSHGPNAWATTIGPPGVSRSQLTRDILARWPEAVFQDWGMPGSGGAM